MYPVLQFDGRYVTEKLLAALLAGTVPLYAGDTAVAEYLFNAATFVNVQQFESVEAVVAFVSALVNNATALRHMVSQPVSLRLHALNAHLRWSTTGGFAYDYFGRLLRVGLAKEWAGKRVGGESVVYTA